MKITLDNRDLANVHIDTYAMFTGESAEEYERESLREDGREDWDTVEINYDHNGVVESLAMCSINIVTQETAHDGIITNIKYLSHGSPKFYNYTTDYYIAEYEVNAPKLNDYIAAHYDEVLKISESYDTPDLAHAGLCHYINNAITADDYNDAMWEREMECYYENQKTNICPRCGELDGKHSDDACEPFKE